MLVLALRFAGLSRGWCVLVILSPAGVMNLLAGQNGLFTAALMIAGLHVTLQHRRWLAGLCWAFLAVKPHLG